MMIGMAGFLVLSCLQTSSPLIRGIMTSKITRSGASLSARSSPATPSGALMTWYPSNSKLSRSPATMLGSSSTIRIFAMTSVLHRNRNRFAGSHRLIERQANGEFAASSRGTVDQNLAAVRRYHMANQGKSKAATLGVVHQRVADPVELLEDLALLVLRYADSVVHDFELHRTVVAKHIHADELAVLGIL